MKIANGPTVLVSIKIHKVRYLKYFPTVGFSKTTANTTYTYTFNVTTLSILKMYTV